MEKSRVLNARGAALIVVLLAIAVLLPPTLVLASLALKWQRQSLDYRDTISEEFIAHAGFEEARNRVTADGLGLSPNEASAFVVDEIGDHRANVRVARTADIVLSQDGRVLEGTAAQRADLELTGVDAEGRVVYQFKRLEIYVVRVDVSRRPTLPEVRVYGVLAKLPDSSIEVLGKSVARGYFEHQR